MPSDLQRGGTEVSATGPILVLGANGKTGRRVIQRLVARDLAVRAGSRSAAIPFDWERPESWHAAVDGVAAIYVSYQPDLAVPGAPEAIAELCRVASACGIRRLVLLSGRGEPEARQCEDIVMRSGCDWTILRCAWFAQNFSENFFVEGVKAGELALPVGAVLEPFIDADDIADVAVAALTDEQHTNRLYELTGPRLLSFSDAVSEIASATGRNIALLPIAIDDFVAAMRDEGQPENVIALVRYLFTTVLDGRNAHVSHGVREALGREPHDFAEYVRTTATTGVWS